MSDSQPTSKFRGTGGRRALIAMRSVRARDGIVVKGPWGAPLRRRIDWGVVGAALFGAVWGFLFGLAAGFTF